MAQLWQNFASGTLSADITSSATTLTSTGFAVLPVVSSPDSLTVVLDPTFEDGNAEVVEVTAHTAGSSSVTVRRATQSTSSRSHASGTAWVAPITAADLRRLDVIESAGWVTTNRLGDRAVTTAKIADDAVTQTQIADNAVRTNQIRNGSVNASKLATGAVGTTQLAASAVTSAKLASDAVSTTVNAAGWVTTARLASKAVSQAKIADRAVGSLQIAGSAIGAFELANGAVTGAKIANATIPASKIVANSLGAGQLASGAVGASEVGATSGIPQTYLGSTAVTGTRRPRLTIGSTEPTGPQNGDVWFRI